MKRKEVVGCSTYKFQADEIRELIAKVNQTTNLFTASTVMRYLLAVGLKHYKEIGFDATFQEICDNEMFMIGNVFGPEVYEIVGKK